MSLTHAQDFPYVALATLPDGSVQLVDWRREPGDTHRTLREAGELSRLITHDFGDVDTVKGRADMWKIPGMTDAIAARGWTEAIKLSRVAGATLRAGTVVGGYEDVLDATDCSRVRLAINKGYVNGRYFSTIKGGTHDFGLTVLEQVGHGRVTDHDLGNWFDYNRRWTSDVELDVRCHDGSPARCRLIEAYRPEVPEGQPWDIRSPWWRPLYSKFYPLAKKLKVA